MIWAPTGEPAFECPCCHYPTLSGRAIFEICDVCGWEDEFQVYPPPDTVIGGANGDYSMTEARENFKQYGYKYRPSDLRFTNDPEELQLRWRIQKVFAEIKRSGPNAELYKELEELQARKSELVLAKQPK
ncbi:MAG: CPCC family cysteine-rich protein [Bdellovibrionota bacterium]